MKHLFFILIALFVLYGCQRENEFIENVSNNSQPQVTVFGSMAGVITDSFGEFIADANVIVGDYVTFTNEEGVFEFQDILLAEDGAYVRVEKEGYFNGSRSFSTKLNETPHVKIELISKELIDQVDSEVGGTVSFGNSVVKLPAGAYQLSDGTNFSGEVEVYATYLDPTKPETFRQMPGELSGINLDGELKALESYGMIGVELISSSGEYLNLPEGTEAEIRMKVPSSLLGGAPVSIPLWHFDEVNGVWVEEGGANLVGDTYVGQVNHFSFWNCDEPFDFVDLRGFVLVEGEDLVGAEIKITDLTSGTCRYGVSGERGFFKGKVPEGRDLLLQVFNLCGGVIYDQPLGALIEDKDLGEIDIAVGISGGLDFVTVSGVLDNCGAGEIEEGFIIISSDELEMIIPVEPDGTFHSEISGCSAISEVEVFGIDEGNGLISLPEITDLDGLENLNLNACEEYFNPQTYEINYEGQNWNPVGDGESIIIPGIDTIGLDGVVISLSIIDPDVYDPVEGVQCMAYFSILNNSAEVEYELVFESQGFSISGVCEKSYETVGPLDVCVFADTTDEINIMNMDLYPGSVTEVSFVIRF